MLKMINIFMLFVLNDLRTQSFVMRIKILLELIPNTLDSLLLFFNGFYLTSWYFQIMLAH